MKKNYFKLLAMAVFMLSVSIVSAQTTDPLLVGVGNGDVVKVIDNKGTIKYLQTNNGITTITSTDVGNRTTTTWQLGGALTEDTNITTGVNEFKISMDTGTFVIDGISEDLGSAATTLGTTGYSLLVRDEATGEVGNILVSDLIDVLWVEDTLGADTTADIDITAVGILSTTSVNRVSVYRNGAKLRATTDYTVSADDTITVTIASIGNEAYSGDVFEVHWIK